MRPEDGPAPAEPPDRPEPPGSLPPLEPLDPLESSESPRSSLEPSEEEALFQHLRRYQARTERRRPRRRTLVTTGTLVAGAGLLIVVASVARWNQAPTPEAVAPRAVLPSESGEPRVSRPDASVRDAAAPPEAVARRPALQPEAPPAERVAAQPERPADRPAPQPAPPAPRPVPEAQVPAAPDAKAPAREPASPAPPTATPAPGVAAVSYQPRERLTTVRRGDTQERVFDRFGTTFEQRNGSVVKIEGMRWRANGRSPHHAQVDVAEVTLADAAAEHLYWFLFGDSRLIAWGRSEEWPAVSRRYQIESDYEPVASRRARR